MMKDLLTQKEMDVLLTALSEGEQYTTIDGTHVKAVGLPDITEVEIRAYIARIREQYPRERITELTIKAGASGQVILDYSLKPPKFERIRRITGKPTVSL